MLKIAVILPVGKPDYLANTVLDGLIELNIEFRATENYPTPFSITTLPESEFISYAQSADLIILCWGKGATNHSLAGKIDKWDKTIFVDGSEVGKDRRLDKEIQQQLVDMTYEGTGAIDSVMLEKCKKYFRREKPYIKGILPFPFGIERRYRHCKPEIKKDLDIVCIFGQEDYPKMRKEVRLIIEQSGLRSVTKKTSGFNFDDSTKTAGRNEFYDLLARAKVGVSVGGGGYDTARFWEILGNDCNLLTENIDIEIPGGLEYKRIYQFKDINEFKEKINHSFPIPDTNEYNDIIKKHSTKARVQYLLNQSL